MNSSEPCYILQSSKQMENTNGVAYVIVCSVVILFLLTTNSLTIIGLWKTNKQFTITQKLIFFQNIIDLFVGIMVGPTQIVAVILSTKAPCTLLVFNAVVIAFPGILVIVTLSLIALIRYVNVACQRHLADTFVAIMVITSVILAAAMSFWYGWITKTFDRKLLGLFYMTASVFVLFMIIILIVCNIRLLSFVKRSTARISEMKKKSTSATYQDNLTKTVIIMCSVLIISYLPGGIAFAISGYLFITTTIIVSSLNFYITWSYLIVMANSGLNSVIYSSRTTAMRKFYKHLYLKYVRRRIKINSLQKIRSRPKENLNMNIDNAFNNLAHVAQVAGLHNKITVV